MKHRVMAAAVVAIFFSIMAYGTSAFYTVEERAHNVITTGGIDIDLEEWQETESGELIPFENVTDAIPGKEISKIVQITNVGASEAYIRINIKKSITLDGEQSTDTNMDLSLISLSLDTENWTEKEDGFYYYNEILKPGDTTTPLFTSVSLDKSMGNMYQNCIINIDVQAQATQVANNGTDVFNAKGWPQE